MFYKQKDEIQTRIFKGKSSTTRNFSQCTVSMATASITTWWSIFLFRAPQFHRVFPEYATNQSDGSRWCGWPVSTGIPWILWRHRTLCCQQQQNKISHLSWETEGLPFRRIRFSNKVVTSSGFKFPFSGEFPVFMTQSAISNLSQSLSLSPASSNKLSSSPDNTVPSNAPSNPSPVVAMQNDMKLVMQKYLQAASRTFQ